MRRVLILCCALLASGTGAQVRPAPGPGDPHVQSVLYDPTQVIVIEGMLGYASSIEFSPDERIESVAVGDSSAWEATATKRGDHLFVKPLQGGTPTNMTVITDARTYAFELLPFAGDGTPAYTIRIRYPAPPQAVATPVSAASVGHYQLSGVTALRPSSIHDDGTKTYIEWAVDQPLPATYTVNADGKQALVNGGMRMGVFVIDRVADQLVFRINKKTARAHRVPRLPRH